MTISKLIKELEKLKKKHGSRAEVLIDLKEFRLVFEEYSHWGIHGLKAECIRFAVDGSFEKANGEERLKTVISIN